LCPVYQTFDYFTSVLSDIKPDDLVAWPKRLKYAIKETVHFRS